LPEIDDAAAIVVGVTHSRRLFVVGLVASAVGAMRPFPAVAARPTITVYKDPT
jgi:hypothetical protein